MKYFVFLCIVFAATAAMADGFTVNKILGRGMNLGNMLDAPSEGEWGVSLDSAYFPLIKSKGFTSVRIPVRWSTAARMDTAAPYAIRPAFFARVKWAVDQALKNGLATVVNVHHYNELFEDPEGQHDRFVAIWRQAAPQFRNYSDSLVFEVLNEPNTKLTISKWNSLLCETLDTIRHSNPTRAVIVGTAEWGGTGCLSALDLPRNDRNLILSVHYYLPFTFTHQKTSWVKGSALWDVAWTGDYFEKKSIADDFEYVAQYARENSLPVNIGEFGANREADMGSRARWTAYCARLFERMGFSWCYWEFCSNFGIYDPDAKKFRDTLVHALISPDTSVLKAAPQPLKMGPSILQNGNFSLDRQHWSLAAPNGRATDTVISGIYRLSIQDPGPFSYGIQLIQGNFTLDKGARYVLSFDAWSERPKTIGAKVQDVEFHSLYMACKSIPLTPKKRHFFKVFTMAETRGDCRVCFDLGGSDTIGIRIAEVALCPLDSPRKK
ncbi:MAG: cellulase family glycosylhydrolase [Chitinivibrionales bacterium]